MNRLIYVALTAAAAAGIAATPALAGLSHNPSFSHQLPVRVPVGAQPVKVAANHTLTVHTPEQHRRSSTPSASPSATAATTATTAPIAAPVNPVEPGDDRAAAVEPGDDRGAAVEPGDDRGAAVEPGDDRTGGGHGTNTSGDAGDGAGTGHGVGGHHDKTDTTDHN